MDAKYSRYSVRLYSAERISSVFLPQRTRKAQNCCCQGCRLDIVKRNPDKKLDSRFRGNDDIFEYSLIKRHPRDKIAGSDFEQTKSGPKGERQEA